MLIKFKINRLVLGQSLMPKNKFIVIEGIEGSGKTTICCYIKKLLHKLGITKIVSVREPGSTPLAEKIRWLIKNNDNNEYVNNETELLLFFAARIQLIKTIVQPELKKGSWIISDRHSLSSLAYQGAGRGIQENIIISLQNLFFKNFYPHITFYLDVKPIIGLNRIKNRKNIDRIESNDLLFFHKVRNRYLKLIQNDPKIISINANFQLNIVKKIIKHKIIKWLKKI